MFALRGLGVSLAFFLCSYVALSIAVSRGWRVALQGFGHLRAQAVADVLLVLRCLPIAVASIITVAFVVPSFLLLEPRVSSEPLGALPLFLGFCCLAMFSAGVWNAAGAHVRTSRTITGWLAGATTVALKPLPVFHIQPAAPALMVAGVGSPRVLVSSSAAAVLNTAELDVAIRHETAHVRRRDNLKKLLFLFCRFPGMSPLEGAWGEAEEMAADDAAVSSRADALDLASALVKLSRLTPAQPAASLATALVQDTGTSLNARVARLVNWDPAGKASSHWSLPWYHRASLLGGVTAMVLTYSAALSATHALTEWMVR